MILFVYMLIFFAEIVFFGDIYANLPVLMVKNDLFSKIPFSMATVRPLFRIVVFMSLLTCIMKGVTQI